MALLMVQFRVNEGYLPRSSGVDGRNSYNVNGYTHLLRTLHYLLSNEIALSKHFLNHYNAENKRAKKKM